MRHHTCLRLFCLVAVLILDYGSAFAKDKPFQTIDWPASGNPVVRFTFEKFKPLEGIGELHAYDLDVIAQNLSQKLIPAARFTVYFFDKNKARIGQDVLTLSNVGPGETVKFETSVSVSGKPESLSLAEGTNASTITLTVNSTPQGAMLSVDGVQQGPTPRLIHVGIGQHTLTFTQEGFTTGTFPLQIGPNDVSGGSVSYQLGSAAFDSVELRDGSVLNGDVVSISGMDVQVRVGGVIQHVDRNAVKRIIFTQRATPAAAPPVPPAAPNQ
jgi:hypothetical protein